jgi:hypothetical protein
MQFGGWKYEKWDDMERKVRAHLTLLDFGRRKDTKRNGDGRRDKWLRAEW